MKPFKLDDIEKKNLFTTPDRYFEKLPNRIQEQVTTKKSIWKFPVMKFSLRYALPALVVVFGLYLAFFKVKSDDIDPNALLADVTIEDMIVYLENNDISTEEILENIDIENLSIDMIEEDVDLLENMDLESDELEEIFQEYDISEEYF
ncbi:hypothetical protein QQ008_26685 [Fulvivirgaceae bacterium BMA10]|uniref:Uncharacterized protein n=1 Tax=Splendidivirga corallicola TaxID=3051826 RepID=A0ABT8L034_9BACT|nr:hypothetical protein [Fulvivirgaceae bacterium BMA10]